MVVDRAKAAELLTRFVGPGANRALAIEIAGLFRDGTAPSLESRRVGSPVAPQSFPGRAGLQSEIARGVSAGEPSPRSIPPQGDVSADAWARIMGITPALGAIVAVGQNDIVSLAIAGAIVPFGAVVERAGGWAKVRLAGPAYLQVDQRVWIGSDRQPTAASELWLSWNVPGAVSSFRPPTARTASVLVGHRRGEIRGNLVPGFIMPALYPVTKTRVWQYADGNYIDIEYLNLHGGQTRLVFVVGGVVAAHLWDDGRLCLAGGIIENPFTSETAHAAADSPNGEIEGGSVAMHFGVPNASTGLWVRVATLDNAGDFRVGAIAEGGFPLDKIDSARFSMASGYGGEPCYAWSALQTALDFTIDRQQTWLRLARTLVGGITNAELQVQEIWENAIAI